MSLQTAQWLNTMTLIGMTEQRGHAWHYRADSQGSESNHYPGFVPVTDVRRRLFSWTAESAPLAYQVPASIEDMTGLDANGQPIKLLTDESRQVIYRSDTGAAFGVFKSGYERHQFNDVLLDNIAKLVTPDGLAVTGDVLGIGSAGLLDGGAIAWVQVERPENVKTPEGVEFRSSILAATSHNGKIATGYHSVNTIVVCDNTMAMALGESAANGKRFKIKHSKYSGLKIQEAREALEIVVESEDSFAADVARLCAIDVTAKQVSQFVDAWSPVPDKPGRAKTMAEHKRDEFWQLYRHDHRVTPWVGTAFGVLQTTNTWDHHYAIVRNAPRAERNMSNAVLGKTAESDAATLLLLDKVLAV